MLERPAVQKAADMGTEKIYVGVDIAKAHVDVWCSGDSAPTRWRNDHDDIAKLVAELRHAAPRWW